MWFPIKRGFMRHTVGHIKAVDGIDLDVKEGQTLGVVGESGSGKTTLGLALLRLVSSEGPIVYLGDRIDGFDFEADAPAPPRTCRSCSRTPTARSRPRLSVAQIIEEGLLIQKPGSTAPSGDARVVARAEGGRARPGRATATRMNSPAASASASPSPARSCSSRNS